MKDYRRRFKAMAQPDRRDWFRIVNKADDNGDIAYIEIFDIIGYDPWWDEGVSASRFIAELREITAPKHRAAHQLARRRRVRGHRHLYNASWDHPVGFQSGVPELGCNLSDQRFQVRPCTS
jgi:hypothetical protein